MSGPALRHSATTSASVRRDERCRSSTTRSVPEGISSGWRRNASRTSRLARFRWTAPPYFLVTVMPSRAGPRRGARPGKRRSWPWRRACRYLESAEIPRVSLPGAPTETRAAAAGDAPSLRLTGPPARGGRAARRGPGRRPTSCRSRR